MTGPDEGDGYLPPLRRDTFVIAVGNWWLRHFLSLDCLVTLDDTYRRGLAARAASRKSGGTP